MTDGSGVLIFFKDFSERGGDRYFLWSDGALTETDPHKLVEMTVRLVCHDYWLISPAIFRSAGRLPVSVVDVVEFARGTSGRRISKAVRERQDVRQTLLEFCDEAVVDSYLSAFYRQAELDASTLAVIGDALSRHWTELLGQAKINGEFERAIDVELPVFNELTSCVVHGIRVDEAKLREHKKKVDVDYYLTLKRFAEKHELPYEVPRDDVVVDRLESRGFDMSGVSLDYILRLLPMQDGFGDDLIELKRIHASRSILNRLSVGAGRIFPILDSQATVTSRIYFRDPALQGLPGYYRDVIVPDKGMELSYVDYDQFEVGVMAALSSDPKMLSLYSSGDLYLEVSRSLFECDEKRGFAKRLFLSYAYGMRRKSLIDAASASGGARLSAKQFFMEFNVFEEWKRSINAEFEKSGRIGTSMGNYLQRELVGPLTPKECRSSVSQVVQGTAALIFKKAILKVASLPDVKIKVPMHDALLVQHSPGFDRCLLIDTFASAMTEHFGGSIAGKASIEPFFKARGPG